MRMRSPKIPIAVASVAAVILAASATRAQDNKFNWKQASGTKINVAFNQHPYADAIMQRLPQFKELTGIDVSHEVTPEENYFDKVTTNLSASSGVPDVFM